MVTVVRILMLWLALAALTFSVLGHTEPQLRWLSRVEVARSPDESPEDRRARLVAAERAILHAARGDVELTAALVVVGELESHYAKNIADGRCGPKQCDRDPKTGAVQSRSYFQLQSKACPQIWERPDEPPDVVVAAKCAARLLRGFRARCGSIDGALSMYGGLACNAMLGKQRGDKVRRLLGRSGGEA